jgi:aerobic-type carbon monoxide dehydrogenase small subunit (CoxS/CutS family)
MMKLKVNGREHTVDATDDTPLLWVLRDHLQLTGTKFGCGIAMCGACTVHVDGQPTRSCSVPASSLQGKAIETVENLARDGKLSVVQEAWLEHDVAQCGYCQSGQIMAATALLNENTNPSDQDIDTAMSGHVCRCGTYQRIREAIHAAAGNLQKEASA